MLNSFMGELGLGLDHNFSQAIQCDGICPNIDGGRAGGEGVVVLFVQLQTNSKQSLEPDVSCPSRREKEIFLHWATLANWDPN